MFERQPFGSSGCYRPHGEATEASPTAHFVSFSAGSGIEWSKRPPPGHIGPGGWLKVGGLQAPERRGSLALALAVALVEALDAATGVDQLLLAGEERVAFVAELECQVGTARGARGERVAAGAANGDIGVLGLYQSLVGSSTLS